MRDRGAVGGDHGEAAVHDRGDDDVAVGLHGHGVEELQTGEAGDEHAATEGASAGDLARSGDVPPVDPARVGFRHVEHGGVRGQGDAVRGVDGLDHLADHRAVGGGVVDAAPAFETGCLCAVVGEPEVPSAVEDEVVWRQERVSAALGVEDGDFARRQVDALDAPAGVVRGEVGERHEQPPRLPVLEAAPVVGDVQGAVGTEGGAVRAAPRFGDGLDATVFAHASDASGGDLDDDDAAVVHDDGPLGETQARRELGEVVHAGSVATGARRVRASRCAEQGTRRRRGSGPRRLARTPWPCGRRP